MAKTSVEVDRDIADRAAGVLGTTTLRETIDAALHEVVNARLRVEFLEFIADSKHFDFTVVDKAWGGDHDDASAN
jgi:Arc/MetJ family transcription regulator